jgi:hypothetical protein
VPAVEVQTLEEDDVVSGGVLLAQLLPVRRQMLAVPPNPRRAAVRFACLLEESRKEDR